MLLEGVSRVSSGRHIARPGRVGRPRPLGGYRGPGRGSGCGPPGPSAGLRARLLRPECGAQGPPPGPVCGAQVRGASRSCAGLGPALGPRLCRSRCPGPAEGRDRARRSGAISLRFLRKRLGPVSSPQPKPASDLNLALGNEPGIPWHLRGEQGTHVGSCWQRGHGLGSVAPCALYISSVCLEVPSMWRGNGPVCSLLNSRGTPDWLLDSTEKNPPKMKMQEVSSESSVARAFLQNIKRSSEMLICHRDQSL